MKTKTQLLMLTILGNLALGGIFLGLSEYRAAKQESSNLAASAGLYQQAWETMANDAFAQGIGAWHPQTGAIEKRDVWNEKSSYEFPESLYLDGPYANPLFNVVHNRDAEGMSEVVAEILLKSSTMLW